MARVARKTHQDTLDSLRRTRRILYAIPESELSAMALDDQVKYGNSLSEITLDILNLETMKLKKVNAAFKTEEQNLRTAAQQLEADLSELEFVTDMVRLASEGLDLVTKIVNMV